MVYEDLETMLKSLADKSELWDKLNEAVSNLASQNATHFGWMVGILCLVVTVLVTVALVVVNYLYRRDKKALKRMEDDLKMRMGKMRRNLKKTISEVEKNAAKAISNAEDNANAALFEFSQDSKKKFEDFKKDSDRLFKEQQVKTKWYFWNSFSMNESNRDYFMLLLSLNHYVEAEYWYFQEFLKFVCVLEFTELAKHYFFVFRILKEKGFPYQSSHHEMIEKSIQGFDSFPQFNETVQRILGGSKSMIQNPPLNLPAQESKS